MECCVCTYNRFVLFGIVDTNWRGSPNDVLVLILLNVMKILDGEHRGDVVKMTLPHSLRQGCVGNLKEQV